MLASQAHPALLFGLHGTLMITLEYVRITSVYDFDAFFEFLWPGPARLRSILASGRTTVYSESWRGRKCHGNAMEMAGSQATCMIGLIRSIPLSPSNKINQETTTSMIQLEDWEHSPHSDAMEEPASRIRHGNKRTEGKSAMLHHRIIGFTGDLDQATLSDQKNKNNKVLNRIFGSTQVPRKQRPAWLDKFFLRCKGEMYWFCKCVLLTAMKSAHGINLKQVREWI